MMLFMMQVEKQDYGILVIILKVNLEDNAEYSKRIDQN